MEFNLNNFIEQQELINTNLIKGTQNLSEAVVYIKNEAIDALSEQVDKLKDDFKNTQQDIKLLKSKNDELKTKLEKTEKTYEGLKNATYVLATDDGKMKELTKKIQRLTYNVTGGKNTYTDILFHKSLTDNCYKQLYNVFQVNSYKRIKIDDFDIAMKTVSRWFGNKQNPKRVITKKLEEYRNDEGLSKNKARILDLYLEKTSGGTI